MKKNQKLTIEEMYAQFINLIYFEIRKHLESLEDEALIEDCAQEVMIKIYSEYDKLAELDHNALTAYIGRMAFGHAVNAFNKEVRLRNRVISFETFDAHAEEKYALADAVIGSEVRDAVMQLKETDREIIEMIIYQEFSYEEAAKMLCISEPAARKRLQRAKENLADVIKRERKKYDRI